jgi:hypothetical protein
LHFRELQYSTCILHTQLQFEQIRFLPFDTIQRLLELLYSFDLKFRFLNF